VSIVKKFVAVTIVGALALAACGGDDDAGSESGGPVISAAWARTSPMSSTIGAMYFVVESAAGDQLTAVTVPSSVADRTELHETVMAGDDMAGDDMAGDDMAGDDMAGDDMAGDGMMTMQQVQMIEIPAGESVALQPGGLHVMLLDLASPLEPGTSFTAQLVFAEAGTVDVSVEVRDEAP